MGEMTIRRAAVSDIPGIMKLLLQVCNVHNAGRPDLFKADSMKYDRKELETLIGDPLRPIFVAVDTDDVLLGYAFCIIQDHTGDNVLTPIKTLYIDDLCIDEALRGRHIGSSIYEAVKDYARSIGCYNLTLNVWACNPAAAKFYAAQGLVPQKTTLETIL